MRIVIDRVVGSSGTVEAEICVNTEDPATAAVLAQLDATPALREKAGYNVVCRYPGAPPGLTRWHHLQAAGAVSGVPEVAPPAHPPPVGTVGRPD